MKKKVFFLLFGGANFKFKRTTGYQSLMAACSKIKTRSLPKTESIFLQSLSISILFEMGWFRSVIVVALVAIVLNSVQCEELTCRGDDCSAVKVSLTFGRFHIIQ